MQFPQAIIPLIPYQNLQNLKQRIALRCTLAALDLSETAAYISRRITVAGGRSAEVFTREAVSAIYAASREGVAVLLVEQHVRAALSLADRAYVLRRGQVVMSGTSEQVRSRLDEVEASYLSGLQQEDERHGS